MNDMHVSSGVLVGVTGAVFCANQSSMNDVPVCSGGVVGVTGVGSGHAGVLENQSSTKDKQSMRDFLASPGFITQPTALRLRNVYAGGSVVMGTIGADVSVRASRIWGLLFVALPLFKAIGRPGNV